MHKVESMNQPRDQMSLLDTVMLDVRNCLLMVQAEYKWGHQAWCVCECWDGHAIVSVIRKKEHRMTLSLGEHRRSDTDRNHCYCFKVVTSDKKSFLVTCSLLQLPRNLHKQPCEPEGALRSVLTAQKLFWDINMSLFELAQSLSFGDWFVRVSLFPLPPRWVNYSETVEGLW